MEERDTHATRGIVRPEDVGRVFTLEHRPPPADLAAHVDRHWLVAWDLRDRPPYRSEVLTHPAVHLVAEPHGTTVVGVRRERDERVLEDAGWAVGTKFLPGGFAPFAGGPVSALTDRTVPVAEQFGAAGADLARAVADAGDHDARLAHVHAFLRARLPARPDPAGELVNAVVAAMRDAAPGTKVDAFARAHGVSVRTLQRLFRRYVGVGPKWVLQRYRLHEALEQLTPGERPDWARFAADLGYFDQAHFIGDFRAVVGRTPAQFAAGRG